MLHIHRAERADGLVAALGDLLADPLPDPFVAEVVAVPTRGMERWLAQTLSTRLGVCANVDFPSPHRIVADAVATACGVDPDADPWRPERAAWRLLQVVEAHLDDPWLARLKRYLGEAHEPDKRARRLSIVRHLAELYDRYALHRPDLLQAWAEGTGEDWQAELWRHLRRAVGSAGPAERLATAAARLEREDVLDLPARLAVFGLTRLPAGHLQVLSALAVRRDVHLFLLHPSPALWAAVAAARPDVTIRRGDPTAVLPHHPLLSSWGRDAREMQLVLARAPHADHHHPVTHREDTLLARLQADIRADRAAHAPEPESTDSRGESTPYAGPSADRPSPRVVHHVDARPIGAWPGPRRRFIHDDRWTQAEADRSIEVHACHGRARQVEVLRDAILQTLAGDPTLEPRDVIVMCPDIETFAPLIQAVFGAGELGRDDELELPDGTQPVDLRVRLADRSLRQTNPVLGVVAQALELAGQRVTASQVLDLADREPVRRRFRFDDDDLTRLQAWIAESGIRWGLDRDHRSTYKLQAIETGTWRFGIDRLLAGVTMTDDERRLLHGVLPLDDVDSGAIDLAGRFTELLARLTEIVVAFSRPQPIGDWAQAIADAADALTATRPREAWQRAELQRILDAVTDHAAGAAEELALGEVRALLADRLQGRPTRANFRTGHLTICTLVPMRSVPHRVVCLLGLDDGVFPRKAPRDGDDLMLAEPRVGERDPRTEDRQLLLDALLAARDKLIVTFTGNDERTNEPRPPAVPVGELLDVTGPGVLVRHPLQPFDPRNFQPGALVGGSPWSFDGATLRGARALCGDRATAGPFLPAPLEPLPDRVLELDDLVRFVAHPVRRFLRLRLGVSLGDFWEEIEDDLDIELDGLGRWEVGERLLASRLVGADGRTARRAEIARGTLPPGQLGYPAVKAAEEAMETIVEAAGTTPAASVDVRVELPDGRSLRGTVSDVCDTTVRTVTFSKVNARHRVTAWARLLALAASDPGTAYSARTIGRNGVREIPPVAGPLTPLAGVVALYDLGMRAPLPLACKTSAAFAEAGEPAARKEWESGFDFPREDRDAEHLRVYGRRLSYDELAALPGFATLAHALWDPLLAAER